MKKRIRELTEGEWAILKAVWQLEPCAAPTVREALEKERKWAYSTVKTLMDRMATKKLLKTEKIRNLILYRSTITRRQAQKSEIKRALTRAFNGALTPMMQFLIETGELTADQLEELETLIKNGRKRLRTNRKA